MKISNCLLSIFHLNLLSSDLLSSLFLTLGQIKKLSGKDSYRTIGHIKSTDFILDLLRQSLFFIYIFLQLNKSW